MSEQYVASAPVSVTKHVCVGCGKIEYQESGSSKPAGHHVPESVFVEKDGREITVPRHWAHVDACRPNSSTVGAVSSNGKVKVATTGTGRRGRPPKVKPETDGAQESAEHAEALEPQPA